MTVSSEESLDLNDAESSVDIDSISSSPSNMELPESVETSEEMLDSRLVGFLALFFQVRSHDRYTKISFSEFFFERYKLLSNVFSSFKYFFFNNNKQWRIYEQHVVQS